MKHKRWLASIVVSTSLLLTGCKSNTSFFSRLESLSNFSGYVTLSAAVGDEEFSLAGDIIDFDALAVSGDINADNLNTDYSIIITNENVYIDREFLQTLFKALEMDSTYISILENYNTEYVYTALPALVEAGQNNGEKYKYRETLKAFAKHLYYELKAILTVKDMNFLAIENNQEVLLLTRENLEYLRNKIIEFFGGYPAFVEQEMDSLELTLTDAQCSQLEDLALSIKQEYLLDIIDKLEEQLSIGEYYTCYINTDDTPTTEVVFKLNSLAEEKRFYVSIEFVSGNPTIKIPDSITNSYLLHNFIS